MSKLGKKPITIPKDTQVKLESGKITLTGPKGSKELTLNEKIFSATVAEDKNLILKLIKKNEKLNILWGTTRSIINSALIGVSIGHEKILEITGVGFRANLKGNILNLQIGFSHDVTYLLPEKIKVVVEKSTIIKISGIDKELVGKVASEIKSLKPVEPYKGKGIKERGQYVLRKEGKKK
ncbi:MAG: large subunit ribosomal protein L6 [Pelagibacterales bacterium]|nr:large subunit ribosomal protein L6 [Pelagibacterales bacterium]